MFYCLVAANLDILCYLEKTEIILILLLGSAR